MKNTHVILLTFILLFNISCNKWIDIKPEGQLEEDDMFSIKDGYQESLSGLYVLMGNPNIYAQQLTLSLLDVFARNYQLYKNSENATFINFADFDYHTDFADKIFTDIWSAQFNVIANCNNLIKYIEKPVSEKVIERGDLYKQLYGETLGLRAFLHFDLLRMFHPSYKSNKEYKAIPYIKTFDEKVAKSRSQSTEKVLNQILYDLKKSYKLLKQVKDKYLNTDEKKFRFNYYAVAGLLARVYMYKGKYENAIKYAKEVIHFNKFSFVKKGDILSLKDFTFSSELVFALYMDESFKEISNGVFPQKNQKYNSTDYLFCNINEINHLYPDKNDVRYKYLFKKNLMIEGVKYCVLKKYKYGKTDNTGVIPIIKLPEMYLIVAECLKETNLSEAVSYLRKLQKGRGVLNLPTITDEKLLQDEISKEYKREFIGEGQLFFYYKRINKPSIKSYKNNGTMIKMTDKKYTFPLPKAESKFDLK
jgi:tetratricopeptide (TPR) repeat protein